MAYQHGHIEEAEYQLYQTRKTGAREQKGADKETAIGNPRTV